MYDRITEVNLLYDFYAMLLTDKQREAIRLYHCENLSLSEISDEFSISRQGVYDALKNAEKALEEYECKLGLLRKFEYTSKLLDNAGKHIDMLINENIGNKELTDKLAYLKKVINDLNK